MNSYFVFGFSFDCLFLVKFLNRKFETKILEITNTDIWRPFSFCYCKIFNKN